MGLGGILKFFFNRLFEATIIILLILYIPNLPPYSKFTKSIKLPPTKPFNKTLTLNSKLNKAEIKYKGRFVGPESFSSYQGDLYTGLDGGDIVKLYGKHIVPVAKTGKPCKAYYEENICGRPLGLKFGKRGYLYVADAYYGILKINVEDGDKETIVSPHKKIGGKRSKWFNGIAVAKNGDLFWTDSSTEFSLQDGLFALLSDPSGRLVHYDAATKKNTVLIDKVSAMGVALSDNEEFVLVSESIRSRILRYHLKGSKKGTYDVFVDGLPGLPDNINNDNNNGFLVPLVTPVDDDHPHLGQTLLRFPLIRKFIARILGITQWIFDSLNKLYPNKLCRVAVYTIGRIGSLAPLFESSRTTILLVSNSGKILDSVHATNRNIKGISEAYIFKNYLYLGSAHEDYIAKIKLNDIGWEHLG